MELHYEVRGKGEPLIILHGLFGSLDNWHSIAVKLSENFKVFTLDQRNHGHSPHSFEMDYRLMAEDVSHFISGQQLMDAFVMGHSMGGKTAMQLALLYPDVVRKLVVVDIAPRRDPPRHEGILAGLQSLDFNHFKTRREMEEALAPSVPDLSTRRFLLKNAARDENGDFHWRFGLEEIQRNYARLTEAVTSDNPFKKPALFVRGEHSDYFVESDLQAVQRLFPHALLKTVPAAGHLVHVENSNVFITIVLEFLLSFTGLTQ